MKTLRWTISVLGLLAGAAASAMAESATWDRAVVYDVSNTAPRKTLRVSLQGGAVLMGIKVDRYSPRITKCGRRVPVEALAEGDAVNVDVTALPGVRRKQILVDVPTCGDPRVVSRYPVPEDIVDDAAFEEDPVSYEGVLERLWSLPSAYGTTLLRFVGERDGFRHMVEYGQPHGEPWYWADYSRCGQKATQAEIGVGDRIVLTYHYRGRPELGMWVSVEDDTTCGETPVGGWKDGVPGEL